MLLFHIVIALFLTSAATGSGGAMHPAEENLPEMTPSSSNCRNLLDIDYVDAYIDNQANNPESLANLTFEFSGQYRYIIKAGASCGLPTNSDGLKCKICTTRSVTTEPLFINVPKKTGFPTVKDKTVEAPLIDLDGTEKSNFKLVCEDKSDVSIDGRFMRELAKGFTAKGFDIYSKCPKEATNKQKGKPLPGAPSAG